VFGPVLYFGSRHQLHRIKAMDTRIHFGSGEKPSFWDTSCTISMDIRRETCLCAVLSTFMVNKVAQTGFSWRTSVAPCQHCYPNIIFIPSTLCGTYTDNVAV